MKKSLGTKSMPAAKPSMPRAQAKPSSPLKAKQSGRGSMKGGKSGKGCY